MIRIEIPMLEPFKKLLAEWWSVADSRKKEYGSFEEWKQRREQERVGRSQRSTGNRFKVTKPTNIQNVISKLPLPKLNDAQHDNQCQFSWLEKIQSIFSTEQQDLHNMKNTLTNYRLPHTNQYQTKGRRGLNSQRLFRSETFKKRMMEKMYDDRMLEQLRESGCANRRHPSHRISLSNSESDQVVLLQNRLRKLEQRLSETQKELELVTKKLSFSNEKTKLLESLLDEASVDDEYVKSRRRIENLRSTDKNQPHLRSLSPSPQRSRPMNPLYTSSPIRDNNIEGSQKHDKELNEFYLKYPTLPETEQLGQDKESLSPVRINYSKYSSPR